MVCLLVLPQELRGVCFLVCFGHSVFFRPSIQVISVVFFQDYKYDWTANYLLYISQARRLRMLVNHSSCGFGVMNTNGRYPKRSSQHIFINTASSFSRRLPMPAGLPTDVSLHLGPWTWLTCTPKSTIRGRKWMRNETILIIAYDNCIPIYCTHHDSYHN